MTTFNDEPHDREPAGSDAAADARGSSVADIRNGIRDDIIAGRLAPGAYLSSAQIAKDYGVSRTPLREAVRMLQEEGFVTQESNHRPRVTTWSADDLESLFVQRILLNALCTSMTVPLLSEDDIAEIDRAMAALDEAEADNDHDRWREADVAFHRAHTKKAPAAVVADLERLNARALMFRHMWLGERHSTMSLAFDDHPRIYRACLSRDAQQAAEAAARHLATVAIALLARVDPSREPSAVREALKFASRQGDGPELAAGPSANTSRSREL
jgi:DNA-binding GntR family transcriptional regulator